ncbi:MAG: NAD-dependent epimerase/dehydratase family protein [Pseudomonadota bacterium]
MRFAVTGATGFVGSHLVDLLVGKGHEVVCPVRDPRRSGYASGFDVDFVTYLEFERLVGQGGRFDAVVHAAGATRALNYEEYCTSNVGLTTRLVELFASAAPGHAPRFVLISSQAAAGPSGNGCAAVNESDPPNPISLYGRSKLEAERAVEAYRERVPFTIIRPPVVFGPRDKDVLNVFKTARYGLAPYLAGADRLVSVVYVEDLVEGILTAALSESAVGRTYFMADAAPIMWRRFCTTVADALGKKPLAIPVPVLLMSALGRAGDLIGRISGRPVLLRSEKVLEMKQAAWVCSVERARIELGWVASTPLNEAVRKTAEWYVREGRLKA